MQQTLARIQPSPQLPSVPMGKQWLNPGIIALDQGTAARADGIELKTAEEYAQIMLDDEWEWEKDIPIVFWDEDLKLYAPAGEGHHRITAAGIANHDIYVDVQVGTLTQAILHGARANQYHQRNRTQADKRLQVTTILTNPDVLEELARQLGQPGAMPSDREIARYCGVSAPFVKTIIKELSSAGNLSLPTQRADKRGRVIETAAIGSKPQTEQATTDEATAELEAKTTTQTETPATEESEPTPESSDEALTQDSEAPVTEESQAEVEQGESSTEVPVAEVDDRTKAEDQSAPASDFATARPHVERSSNQPAAEIPPVVLLESQRKQLRKLTVQYTPRLVVRAALDEATTDELQGVVDLIHAMMESKR